jgi:hypothetical protein
MPMPRLCGGMLLISLPPSLIAPLVAVSKPASIIRQVVFPDPDGPNIVRNSPFRNVKV